MREEPELLDRPNPPDEVGLLGELVLLEVVGLLDEPELVDGLLPEELVDGVPKERCDWVGLEMALALAATLSALGEAAGLDMTGWDEVVTDEPAVRDFIEPL